MSPRCIVAGALHNGQMLQFAVNTFARSSNPVTTVYHLFLDVNGDGVPDYDVQAIAFGFLTTGSFNGEMVVAVFNLATKSDVLEFLATAVRFKAFNNSISTDALVALAPGASASVPIAIDRKEFARTPALGEMLVPAAADPGGPQRAPVERTPKCYSRAKQSGPAIAAFECSGL